MKSFVKKMVFVFVVFLVLSRAVYAQELTGNMLAQWVYDVENGDDRSLKSEMILVDKKGNTRNRELEIFSKDYGDLSKTFLEFLSPADIKNTRFLSMENEDKDDTQYLYLPALGRSRRIVSSQNKIRFANTDYTYEDMQRRKPEKDAHKIVGSESLNGFDCYVLESIPLQKKSQYGKRISWIDKTSFIAIKIEFYDKKQRLVKEFNVYELKEIQGIWTAISTVMNDLKAKHKTIMNLEGIKYNQNISDSIFKTRHMEEK